MTKSPWAFVPVLPPDPPKKEEIFEIVVKDAINHVEFLFACVEQGLKLDNPVKVLSIRHPSVLLHTIFNASIDTVSLDEEVPDGYFRVKSPLSPLGFEEYKIERDNGKNIPISKSVRDEQPIDIPTSESEPKKAS